MHHDGWALNAIDTARHADYLSEVEKEIFLSTNALRSNPAVFAQLYVTEIMGYYDGTLLRYPGDIPIQTFEGHRAASELYDFLLAQSPVGLLYPSRGLSRAAADHARDQAQSGRTSHNGRDGSDPFTRISRYGRWSGTAAENIAYGKNDALRIILQLAIDDGIAGRGHRANLFNPDFSLSGVGIDTHPEYGHSCTMEYATAYEELFV